uniref:Patatin like phospholipase domain containing 8 n=1 Tax=Erpetoichthys calabaricus TaxID=27687 RepID=A0A8C4RGE0_ERPCA
ESINLSNNKNSKEFLAKQKSKQLAFTVFKVNRILSNTNLSNSIYVYATHYSKGSFYKLIANPCPKRKCVKYFLRRSCHRHKFGSCGNVSQFSTTFLHGLTGLSCRMSRIRNTFDSVTKAVSGSHTELLNKIVRLKPNALVVEKPSDSQAEIKELNKCVSLNTNDDNSASTFQKKLESSPASKDTKTDLFHPSYLSTNFGETYNFLSNHINGYFTRKTGMEEEKNEKQNDSKCVQSETSHIARNVVDGAATETEVPESTSSFGTSIPPKKKIAQFLLYPSNSVQAFVDNYLGTFVPKFRHDTKDIAEIKDKSSADVEVVSKKGDLSNGKDPKSAEEKAKRLSLQREKIIARVSVDNRTRALVQALKRTSDIQVYINRVEELSYHLLEFSETRGVAVKEKIIPCLLRLRQNTDESLQAAVREALSLVGYADPVKGNGIRVLSIDGGGTRGLVALQTLYKLEELTGKPVYQLFDYICGVSTGAILAFMLGVFQIPLKECEEMYRRLGSDVFKQNVIVGTMKMGWSHAFYDSETWENILKDETTDFTIVNRGTPLKAYIFRNYNLLPGTKSHYLGGCQHKLWQALRASSAAPGYFQEYSLGSYLHQDGGLLINNPSALALHECKSLWPDTPVQCLISLGTGRYESLGQNNVTYTSLKTKLTNVISSATDTEEVHTMLDALLLPDTYFRFNPVMNEDIPLDENRKEKLNQLQMDGIRYLERNENKLKKAAKILMKEKTTSQKVTDWIKLKAAMYDGIAPFSKL